MAHRTVSLPCGHRGGVHAARTKINCAAFNCVARFRPSAAAAAALPARPHVAASYQQLPRRRSHVCRTALEAEGSVEVAPGVFEGYWMWRGYRIRYQRSGDVGEPVVMVHGFGGNADHWRKVRMRRVSYVCMHACRIRI